MQEVGPAGPVHPCAAPADRSQETRNVECRRPAARLLAAAASCLLLAAVSAPPAAADDEVEVQAAFVSKLGRFVTWPDSSFDSTHSPVVVGLLGSGPLAEAVQATLAGETVRGRPYEIRSLGHVSEADACHIVIVSETSRGAARRIGRELRHMGALSVGHTSDFAEAGGTIGMVMHKGRVAFDVNNHSAKQADLKIDGRLLRLATNIY
jgi:hypothetical protein